MGNTRSASYSYEQQHHSFHQLHHGGQQQRYPHHLAHPQHVYQLGQPALLHHQPGQRAVLYHSQYWNDPASTSSSSTGSSSLYYPTSAAAVRTEQREADDGPDEPRPAPETTSSAVESPAPFVRHRNAPIRLPRINSKDCWQGSLGHLHGSHWQYSLLRRTRHKSLSCSMVHRDAPADAASQVVTSVEPSAGADAAISLAPAIADSDAAAPSTVAGAGDERRLIRGAVSCASLLLARPESAARIDRRSRTSSVSSARCNRDDEDARNRRQSPFRRQCFATRSYQQYSRHAQSQRQRRPLLTTSPSASLSASVLTDAGEPLDDALHCKVRAYLETARLKKQSVEQSLSQIRAATPDANAQSSGAASPHPHTVSIHKSWISISQGSLDDDELDGFTRTLTGGGDAASLHSRLSDASYLTLMTAHTSLSSGYHGPASGTDVASTDDDHQAYRNNRSEPSECEFDSWTEHEQQWFNARSDGAASGVFYMEWLRQVSGSVPAYVELRQGRLHLKLTQGQCAARVSFFFLFFRFFFTAIFLWRPGQLATAAAQLTTIAQ